MPNSVGRLPRERRVDVRDGALAVRAEALVAPRRTSASTRSGRGQLAGRDVALRPLRTTRTPARAGSATTPKSDEQRQAELPVVAEAVAARAHHHQVRRRRHRREERRPRRRRSTHISTGCGETSDLGGGRDRDRDHDQRRRHVADQLAEHGRQHEQAEQQRVPAAVADDRARARRPARRPRRSASSRSRAGSSPPTRITVVHEIAR